MKKIFSIFLVFIVLGGIYINLSMSSNKKQTIIYTSTFEADGTKYHDDLRESINVFMEDSISKDFVYIPEFLSN